MSARTLHRCPICREWFNTTSAVMIDHYMVAHYPQFRKTLAIDGVIVNHTMLIAKAWANKYVAAKLIQDQVLPQDIRI